MLFRRNLDTLGELRGTVYDGAVDGDIVMVTLSSTLAGAISTGMFRIKDGFSTSGETDDGFFFLESSSMSDKYFEKIHSDTFKRFNSPITTLADDATMTLTHDADTLGMRFPFVIRCYPASVTETAIGDDLATADIVLLNGNTKRVPFDMAGITNGGGVKLASNYEVVQDGVALVCGEAGFSFTGTWIIGGDDHIYLAARDGVGLETYYLDYTAASGALTYTNNPPIEAPTDGWWPQISSGYCFTTDNYFLHSYTIESDGSLTERDELGTAVHGTGQGNTWGAQGYWVNDSVGLFANKGASLIWGTWSPWVEALDYLTMQGSGWSNPDELYDESTVNGVHRIVSFPWMDKESVFYQYRSRTRDSYGRIIEVLRGITAYDSAGDICDLLPSSFDYGDNYTFLPSNRGKTEAYLLRYDEYEKKADHYALTVSSGAITGSTRTVSDLTVNPTPTGSDKIETPESNDLFFSSSLWKVDADNKIVSAAHTDDITFPASMLPLSQTATRVSFAPVGSNKLLYRYASNSNLYLCHISETADYENAGFILRNVIDRATAITSMTVSVSEPTNTSVRFSLLAEDGTLYKWDTTTSHWISIATIDLGNTETDFEAGSKTLLLTEVGQTCSLAVALLTTSSTATPIFYSFDITYSRVGDEFYRGYYNGYETGYCHVEIEKLSTTQTRFTNLSGGSLTIRAHVLIPK